MKPLPEISASVSNLIFLMFVVGIPVYGFLKGIKVYETFVDGAKEGFDVAVRIIPYLVAILVGVGMFRASGAMQLIRDGFPHLLASFGLSPEVLTMGLMRPLSGAATLGMLGDIITSHGADSYRGPPGIGHRGEDRRRRCTWLQCTLERSRSQGPVTQCTRGFLRTLPAFARRSSCADGSSGKGVMKR